MAAKTDREETKYSCFHEGKYYISIMWDNDEVTTYYAFVLDMESKNFGEPIISLEDDYPELGKLLYQLDLQLKDHGIKPLKIPAEVREKLESLPTHAKHQEQLWDLSE